ncbi:MAG: ComF family protein [Clostridia bacterium]|nr:ComF family protein [Clostridia bacterium]
MTLSSLKETLLFFFFPPKCAGCGRVGFEGLCPECKEHLDSIFTPKKFLTTGGIGFADGMFALFPYQDPLVKKLLFDWKRENYADLAPIFFPYIEKAVKKKLFPAQIHAISFLPRRQSARRKNGFDQAEEILKLVAKSLSLPAETLLKRRGYSRQQHKEKFEKREQNVHGVFAATRDFQGETILLIDDIVTTGATAREGARILKKHGAMKVYVFSLAH